MSTVPPVGRTPFGPLSSREKLIAMALVSATALAYLPTLAGQFIWNDNDYVTKPALRSVAGLEAIWTKLGATEQYYPLLHSAFWIQHRLWGDHPLGYHLVTLALHLFASLLFAFLLRRLAIPGAWLAAALFALHPVHVESVAWITEQKNTLSLVLYLASALAYLKFDDERTSRAYTLALLWFILSLLCKTVTVTLPAALLVVLWWKRGKIDLRRDFAPLIPWLILGAGAGFFSSWVERHFLGAQGGAFEVSFAGRAIVAGRAIWFYLGKLFWPFELNFIYQRWDVDPSVALQWIYPLGVIILAILLWKIRRTTRTPLAVFLIFVGSLFPVLGFVNLYGALYSWVWDHWQYSADLAVLALVAAVLTRAWMRLPAHFHRLGPAAAAGGAILLGALTWTHGKMFHDNETLYRATLARNPDCWMAHYNLGRLLSDDRARLAEAISHFEAATRLRPQLEEAHTNLGDVLSRFPDRALEAIAEYRSALRINPSSYEARLDLGNALASLGRPEEAVPELEFALQLRPGSAEAHNSLGNVLSDLPGRLAEAIAHYEAALKLAPDFAEGHYNLAMTLSADPHRTAEAIVHYQTALRLRPNYPEAHNNLGTLLANLPGREGEALTEYEAALRENPRYFDAHYNLAVSLETRPERNAEAITHLEAALHLRPDFEPARLELERLRASRPIGETVSAVK